MKVISLNLYSFNQSVTVNLPNIGVVALDNALSEAEVDSIFAICMSAACRKLNMTVLEESIKPEVLHLEHIQDGSYTEVNPF